MGKLERRKDAAQEAIESTSIRVGRIATIITTAVADVAREIGDAVSDALEMRQAAKAAAADEARQTATSGSAATSPSAVTTPSAVVESPVAPAAAESPAATSSADEPGSPNAGSPEPDRG